MNMVMTKELKWRVLNHLYLGYILSGAVITIFGAILPHLIEEEQLNYAVAGGLISILAIGNFCASIIYPLAKRHFSHRAVVVAITGLSPIVMLLLTIHPPVAFMYLLVFVLGITKGTVTIISNLAMNVATNSSTKYLNILHTTFAVGAFASPFIMAALLALGFPWRIIMYILCVSGAIFPLNYWTMDYRMLEEPQPSAANAGDHRADGCSTADPAGTTPRSAATTSSDAVDSTAVAADTAQGGDGSSAGCIEQGQAAGAPNLQALLTNRSFLIITFIMFMYVGFENTVNGWFVTYLKDTGVMTSALATAMVSVTWIMMMAGRMGTAQFLQNVNKLQIILVSALIDFVAIVLLVNTHTATMAAIIIAVLGLGMSAIYPTTVAAAGPIIEGSTMGLSLLTGISAIGGILVPQIIGILADQVGIAGAMVTVVLTVGIMLALSILAVLRDRRGLMG
ncbi:MAG: MFS transporter [Lachnospiraceae bacterium]|nr:MFS transporter [Lachnospiraceae bacterium]